MPRSRSPRLHAIAAALRAAPIVFAPKPAGAVTGNAAADSAYAYTARLEIGEGDTSRACSGALIEQRWVVTAASCFATDPTQPASVSAGAPSMPAKVTVGRTDLSTTSGQVRDIVELVPRTDRDLVLARLSSAVHDITPVALSADTPAGGEELSVAGYGRTKDEWVPDRLHTGTFTVADNQGPELDVDGQDNAAICRGDAGGPAVCADSGGELVAISSRSWQGGCFGSEETRTGAVETRVDDITDWIGAQVARWTMKAEVNDTYVTTELNATGIHEGELRARADKVGGWELFTLYTPDNGKTVALRSLANNLFVSTELNDTGDYEAMLRARTESPIGSWEFFTLASQGNGKYSLESTANDKYVSAENNYTGEESGLVRARSDSVVGGWERFTLQHADNYQVAGHAPADPAPLPLN